LDALFTADPGANVYVNTHTAAFPGGAIRAPLRRTDRTVFQVNMSPANEVPQQRLPLPPRLPSTSTPFANSDGSIPAGAVIFDVNPIFPAGQSFAAMHIHDNVAGVNGNVTIDSKLTATPLLTSDSGGNIWRLATVSSAAGIATLNSLMQNPRSTTSTSTPRNLPAARSARSFGPPTRRCRPSGRSSVRWTIRRGPWPRMVR